MPSVSSTGRGDRHSSGLLASMVVSVSLASVIECLLLLRGFYSATLDESGRTLDAYNWIHGTEPLATVWLPFYKVVVGAGLLIAPDLFVTPRVISYLFGMIALCAVIWLARILFNNGATTVLTGLMAAVFPARAILTVAPLAEIMFMAVIVIAIGFFSRWLLLGRDRDIWLSAIFFAVGSSVRYEGWILVGVFASTVLVICFRRSVFRAIHCRTAAGLILVSLSLVAFWILLHWIGNGKPFGFVAGTADRYVLIHGDSFTGLLQNNPLVQFVLQNVLTLNILGMLSVAKNLRRSSPLKIAVLLPFLALIFLSLVTLLGKGMPTHGFWRVPAAWSVLLIPFTADWFASRLDPSSAPKKLNVLMVVAALVCSLGLCLNGIFSMSEHSAFSKDDLAAGRYVKAQFLRNPPPGKVLIESDIWSYINVMVASQHPEWFVLNSGFDPTEHQAPLLDPDVPLDVARMQRMDVTLLVFRRDDYREHFQGNKEVRTLAGFGPWTVYTFASVSPLH